jgi:hypothetical protein
MWKRVAAPSTRPTQQDELMNQSWHPVIGYEGLYEVSDLGNVRSVARLSVRRNNAGPYTLVLKEKLLNPGLNSRGYKTVSLYKEGRGWTVMVHKLVAQAFIGDRPEGHVIRHGKYGKAVNAVYNLSYGTCQDNSDDMVKDGKSLKGAKHHKTNLSDADVLFIMRWPVYYGSKSYLRQKYNISKSILTDIRSGKTWQHLHPLVNPDTAATNSPTT